MARTRNVRVAVVAMALLTFVHALGSGRIALAQAPTMSSPNCTYELKLPGGVHEFKPKTERILPQETSTIWSCAFDATLPPRTELRVTSNLVGAKGTVRVKPPGKPETTKDITGTDNVVPVEGGTIRVDLEGKTPRGVASDVDQWGYRRELHRTISFPLIQIAVKPPGSQEQMVEAHTVEAASTVYIDALRKVDQLRQSKAQQAVVGTADILLRAGFPQYSLQVASLSVPQTIVGSPWLWRIVMLVVGMLVVGLAWGVAHKSGSKKKAAEEAAEKLKPVT